MEVQAFGRSYGSVHQLCKTWPTHFSLLGNMGIPEDLGPQSDVVAVNCTISACGAAARWQEAGEL